MPGAKRYFSDDFLLLIFPLYYILKFKVQFEEIAGGLNFSLSSSNLIICDININLISLSSIQNVLQGDGSGLRV